MEGWVKARLIDWRMKMAIDSHVMDCLLKRYRLPAVR